MVARHFAVAFSCAVACGSPSNTPNNARGRSVSASASATHATDPARTTHPLALRACTRASPPFVYRAALSGEGRLALGFQAADYTSPGTFHVYDFASGSGFGEPQSVALDVPFTTSSAAILRDREPAVIASPPFGSSLGVLQVRRPSRPALSLALDSQAYHNTGDFALAASEDLGVIALGLPHAKRAGCTGYCSYPGAVEIFRTKGEVLVRGAMLQSDEFSHDGDRFGQPVAMSSDGAVLAVGSNDGAFLFLAERESFHLVQSIKTPPDVGGSADSPPTFGEDLALSSDGRTLVIGNWTHDTLRGRVLIYVRRGDEWQRTAALLAGAEERLLGGCVAISSDGKVIATDATKGEEQVVVIFRAANDGAFGRAGTVALPKASGHSPPTWIALDRTGERIATMDGSGNVCAFD
jgi:hypothetical protein